MKNNKYVSSSRRRTPWDDKVDILLEMALKTKKSLKFREYYQKNTSKMP